MGALDELSWSGFPTQPAGIRDARTETDTDQVRRVPGPSVPGSHVRRGGPPLATLGSLAHRSGVVNRYSSVRMVA